MKFPNRFSYSLFEPIKKHRALTSLIIVIIGVCIFCAILSGIKFSNSSLVINFSNVSIVKFLRDTSGFGGMLFTNLFSISVFCTIIISSCCKKYTISIGLFFYGYYVYSQVLTLIAFVLEFGIINTLVISFCLLIGMLIIFFLLLDLFVICIDFQNEHLYFKSALYQCIPILIIISIVLLSQSLIFLILKNYILILVY